MSVGVIASEKKPSFYAFARDVTRRRAAEEELRARERQLSEALTLANLGSWAWEVATNDMTWSNELYVIHALDPDTLVTFDTYISHVHPEDRPNVERVIERAMRQTEPFEFEHRIVRGDGSVRWVHWRAEMIMSGDRPQRLYGTAEDITDRKQTETLQALLAAIVESTDDAIKSMATDGTLTSWNAAAQGLYGYMPREILGRSVLELFPPESTEAAKEVLIRVIQDGRVERCELKHRRRDGTIIDVAATLSPIRVGGKIVGVSA